MTTLIRTLTNAGKNRIQLGRFYLKCLILVLLITSVPSAVIAIGSYFIGIHQIEQQIDRTHTLLLKEVSGNMDDKLSQLELLISRWAYNSLFDEKLRHIAFTDELDLMRGIFQSLLMVGGSNPLIENAHLFLDNQHALISNERGIENLSLEQMETYRQLLRSNKGFVWTRNLFDNKDESDIKSVSLVYKLPWDSLNPFGALVVNLNKTEVNSIIRQLNPEGNGASFLLDEKGDWITTGKDDPRASIALETALRDTINGKGEAFDSFIFEWNKESYAVSYGKFPSTRWTYVTATSLSEQAQPVTMMSRLILTTSLFALLVAVALAWFASRKIYQPIGRLVRLFRSSKKTGDMVNEGKDEMEYIETRWLNLTRESEELEGRLKDQLPSLREGFLLQLVQGHLSTLSETNLMDRMVNYGWDVRHSLFTLSLIQLSGLAAPGGKFGTGDEYLAAFAASNIINEIAREQFERADMINFQDLSLALFLTFPKEKPKDEIMNELYQLSEKITHTLHSLLSVEVTVMLGEITEHVRRVPKILEQARNTIWYRDTQKKTQILDTEVFFVDKTPTIQYPFDIERELLQALRMGLEEEADRLTEAFIAELQANVSTELLIHQAAQQLLGNILNTVLQSGLTPFQLYNGANLYVQFLSIRQPDKMKKWLQTQIIRPYIKRMKEMLGLQSRQLVERIVDYLKEHYYTDLSLESCADRFGITSPYLSRVFKHIMGINFIDYVTRIRLERTKELLLATDMKMNEIADQVGYQQSYLSRIFKKHEGLTLTEYREKFKS